MSLEAPARCPACGGAPRPLARPVRGHELRRCPGCGLRWWDFTGLVPEDLYGEEYFRGAAACGFSDYYAMRPAIERTARARLGRIRRRLGLERGRLLDLGCGAGFFLAVARSEGWEVEGVDVSEAACRYARDELGLTVHRAALGAGLVITEGFDLVTLWDVMEHVPDPAGTIGAAAGALRPGGALVLTTGDVESLVARVSGGHWHLYNFPEHLYFHTVESVRRLLENAGLRLRAMRREAVTVTLAYTLERLLKTMLGWEKAVPSRVLGRILLPANLGDVITAYAERPWRA